MNRIWSGKIPAKIKAIIILWAEIKEILLVLAVRLFGW